MVDFRAGGNADFQENWARGENFKIMVDFGENWYREIPRAS